MFSAESIILLGRAAVTAGIWVRPKQIRGRRLARGIVGYAEPSGGKMAR
jgi:hypothetical protein